MAIHIRCFKIDHFRGIHNLSVENLNNINIVAGDNNSGKTSVLEALMLLRNPYDVTNILRLARMRDINIFLSGTSLYESFINLFPQDTYKMEISLNATCKGEFVSYKLFGEQKKILIDIEDIIKKSYPAKRSSIIRELTTDIAEVDAFSGELVYEIAGQRNSLPVVIDAYMTTSGREVNKKNYINVAYLSPIDHVSRSVCDNILRVDTYKDICLRILQLFDPEIIDLLLLKSKGNNRPTEYIKHAKLGNMPLSTYGDGIKKVLSLANAIAQAAGGVLLIDEVETAIHSKYYDDIFKFIVKASIQFNVQVFITTHNIEAIDGLLHTQDYEKQYNNDDISVITFQKDSSIPKTYSRVLTGRQVFENREQFGFEVRL